jgi:hypothetical protein
VDFNGQTNNSFGQPFESFGVDVHGRAIRMIRASRILWPLRIAE